MLLRHGVMLMLAGGVLLSMPASTWAGEQVELSAGQLEELVRRSYQYVAMFNVNNKMALDEANPMSTGGYNRVKANTRLADHTLQAIARPNNDTLYAGAMVDVTEGPIVLEVPAFDSSYVSLMITAYDHYVNIPASTGKGDFDEPVRFLLYSERTPGYDGAPVTGIDHVIETTGDFVSAVFRVMPHAAEPERMAANIAAMQDIDLLPLSEFLGGVEEDTDFVSWGAPPGIGKNLDLKADLARFPAFGSDFEIYEVRFLEVMQFVLNHTTFDPDDEIDAGLLQVLQPLGVSPGRAYDTGAVAEIDGAALAHTARRIAMAELARASDKDFLAANGVRLFQPKGHMDLDMLLFQSVIGPIGQPAAEAVYPAVGTEDGQPMNAMHDYEIVMAPGDMPPAKAFWSATLYESETGFFVPNERFKYSVGENAGYRLGDDGGIRIVIAAEAPEGVPEENWLPVNRGDYDIDIILRLYAPDLGKLQAWTAPVARKLN